MNPQFNENQIDTAPVIVDTESENIFDKVDRNPFLIRWAFNAVVRDKYLGHAFCGIEQIPFARFFAVKTYSIVREVHTTDEYKPREEIATIPAADAQNALEHALGGKAIQSPNWGLQVGFTGITDAGLMETLTQNLLPTLSTIRAICAEYGYASMIEPICPASDDLDFGRRETCVTCWYQWLNSPACTEWCRKVSEDGFNVTERNKDTFQTFERVIRPTLEDFEQARAMALAAFRVGISTLEGLWSDIASEDEKGQRRSITEHEHTYRKDLHRTKPADRQIAIAQTFAKASSDANSQTSALVEQLAAGQAQMQQFMMMQAAQNGMMNNQQTNQIQQPQPELTPAQKAAITKAANQAANEARIKNNQENQ